MSVGRRDQAFRDQPSLFDSPLMAQALGQLPAAKRPSSELLEQERQLARVKLSIADVIVEFFESKKPGDEFFASDLHQFVQQRAQIAPASADRVMRDLRKSNAIAYSLVSRHESRYRVEARTEQ